MGCLQCTSGETTHCNTDSHVRASYLTLISLRSQSVPCCGHFGMSLCPVCSNTASRACIGPGGPFCGAHCDCLGHSRRLKRPGAHRGGESLDKQARSGVLQREYKCLTEAADVFYATEWQAVGVGQGGSQLLPSYTAIRKSLLDIAVALASPQPVMLSQWQDDLWEVLPSTLGDRLVGAVWMEKERARRQAMSHSGSSSSSAMPAPVLESGSSSSSSALPAPRTPPLPPPRPRVPAFERGVTERQQQLVSNAAASHPAAASTTSSAGVDAICFGM